MSLKEQNNVYIGSKPMEQENLTKMDYLYLLRKFSKVKTLETVIEHKEKVLTPDQLAVLYSAVDHRLVEIITGKLFDKVPKEAWGLIR